MTQALDMGEALLDTVGDTFLFTNDSPIASTGAVTEDHEGVKSETPTTFKSEPQLPISSVPPVSSSRGFSFMPPTSEPGFFSSPESTPTSASLTSPTGSRGVLTAASVFTALNESIDNFMKQPSTTKGSATNDIRRIEQGMVVERERGSVTQIGEGKRGSADSEDLFEGFDKIGRDINEGFERGLNLAGAAIGVSSTREESGE